MFEVIVVLGIIVLILGLASAEKVLEEIRDELRKK